MIDLFFDFFFERNGGENSYAGLDSNSIFAVQNNSKAS